MALVDQIIGVESGGNPDATLRAFPHMGDKFRANALVTELYFSSSPSTVFWGVIAVVIDPIKGMLCAWARPHIGKEILKSGPAVTNLNAPSSIVFVRSMFRKFTASLHSVPYLVFGSCFAAARYRNGHPVRTIGDSGRLNLIATTARCVPGLEIRNSNGDAVPAVTLTGHPPYRRCWSVLPEFWLRFRSSDQPAKSHAGIVYALAWGQL